MGTWHHSLVDLASMNAPEHMILCTDPSYQSFFLSSCRFRSSDDQGFDDRNVKYRGTPVTWQQTCEGGAAGAHRRVVAGAHGEGDAPPRHLPPRMVQHQQGLVLPRLAAGYCDPSPANRSLARPHCGSCTWYSTLRDQNINSILVDDVLLEEHLMQTTQSKM